MADFIVVQEASPYVILGNEQGPPGPPGIGGADKTNFAYGDATPALLETLTSGFKLLTITIAIETAFDGVGALLTIGTSGDNSQFVSSTEVDVTTPGIYEVNPNFKTTGTTNINLYITPGSGASSGSGTILLHYFQL